MISSFFDFMSALGWSLIPFLVMINFVVFFHELGHYAVARLCGVKIETFSLGFGPEIVAYQAKTGTRWRIALIPIGGYVQFLGDGNAASVTDTAVLDTLTPEDKARTLEAQSLLKRAAIVVAGPLANFLLAIVIFTAVFSVFGQTSYNARIGKVMPNSPAAIAGFQAGDIVKIVNDRPIRTFQDLQHFVAVNTGLAMHFVVERSGHSVTLNAVPQLMWDEGGLVGRRRIGRLGLTSTADPADVLRDHCTPLQCTGWAVNQVSGIIEDTLSYIRGLIAGRESGDQLTGIVGMSQITKSVAQQSFWDLFGLAAMFSVSVGLMNLFPIPLLDGGHLMFYLAEAVCGRALGDRVQMWGFRIGVAFIASLTLFTATRDILRLFHHN